MTTTSSPIAPVSPTVMLTARQRACVEQIARRQTNPQRLVRRAKILLALDAGANKCHVACARCTSIAGRCACGAIGGSPSPLSWRRWKPKGKRQSADDDDRGGLDRSPHARGRQPPLRRNRSSRLSRWRVKPRRSPGGPSVIGRPARSPRRSANEGLSRRSAPAVSGVF